VAQQVVEFVLDAVLPSQCLVDFQAPRRAKAGGGEVHDDSFALSQGH
jgi:hypothetical protein